jgi:hypothetical protein
MCACMYVCVYVCRRSCEFNYTFNQECIYIHACKSMYAYIYIYICTNTRTYTHPQDGASLDMLDKALATVELTPQQYTKHVYMYTHKCTYVHTPSGWSKPGYVGQGCIFVHTYTCTHTYTHPQDGASMGMLDKALATVELAPQKHTKHVYMYTHQHTYVHTPSGWSKLGYVGQGVGHCRADTSTNARRGA